MSIATLTIDINAKLANLEQDLGRVSHLSQKTADVISSGWTKAAIAVTGINEGIELVGRAFETLKGGAEFIVEFVKGAAEAQDQMGKLAQKAGMTVEAFSGMSYAARLADVDNQALIAGTKELSKQIVEAGRNADQSVTPFGNMGVALRDSAGQLRGTDKILFDVAEKFAGMEDGANKSTLAIKLFGKSGLDLIPFLNQGKDGIQQLTKEAERLGLVVGGEAARASEQFNDNLTRLAAASEGLKRSIGNAALPVMNELVQQLVEMGSQSDSTGNKVRGMFSQTNIEDWAQKSAFGAATVADGFRYVAAAAQSIGIAVGGAALATYDALHGDFAKAAEDMASIPGMIQEAFTFDQLNTKVDQWFDEYHRTVRVNGERMVVATAEDAKRIQKIYDDLAASQKSATKRTYEFDEATLKKQDALRQKYADAENARIYGALSVQKDAINKKYEQQLADVQGAQNQAQLEIDIRDDWRKEIEAIEAKAAQSAIAADATVLQAVKASSMQRVSIEQQAADQVVALWDQANAAKAQATGGDIANRGTSGEFVSSWQGNKYVGQVGSNTSTAGALGGAHSLTGRQLSIQEEIAMLNGYARFGYGFANGGSFMVGGNGGTDSQLVQFKASPDERVTIETPEQQRARGGNVTVNVNVSGGNPQNIISAIKQALRTDPNLFNPGYARAG